MGPAALKAAFDPPAVADPRRAAIAAAQSITAIASTSIR
jgi:hypothetical protein